MEKILILADSRDYVRNNCFQMQLHRSLKVYDSELGFDYYFISPKKLRNLETLKLKLKPKSYRFVLSTLRQRVLFNDINFIQKLIGDLPLKVYDQDPWNNYIDSSKSNGCYSALKSQLHLIDLYVASKYWKNYIELNDKIRTTFVKMSMLPELCNIGIPQQNRLKTVEFRGTLYPHRKKAFDIMNDSGQIIHINTKILSYTAYLEYLRKLAIFVHDESDFWVCNGESIPMSTGTWHKDVEIASQGCFSIRNYHEESKSYSIEKIPLVKYYKDPKEIKHIVDEIYSLSIEELKYIQESSVDHIKRTNDWQITAKTILGL
jgi:hypothetical protein